jgi:hypothetical protein
MNYLNSLGNFVVNTWQRMPLRREIEDLLVSWSISIPAATINATYQQKMDSVVNFFVKHIAEELINGIIDCSNMLTIGAICGPIFVIIGYYFSSAILGIGCALSIICIPLVTTLYFAIEILDHIHNLDTIRDELHVQGGEKEKLLLRNHYHYTAPTFVRVCKLITP